MSRRDDLMYGSNKVPPQLLLDVAAELAPRWMDRPDRPGLWLLDGITDKPSLRWSAMLLNQEDLDLGAPFGTRRVYGPVPIAEVKP